MNLQKAKVWQSKKYLKFVASLECCASSLVYTPHDARETVVPHHVEGNGRRKRDDLTIPLCKYHHDAYHASRAIFEHMYGVDTKKLIAETQAQWFLIGGKAEWKSKDEY